MSPEPDSEVLSAITDALMLPLSRDSIRGDLARVTIAVPPRLDIRAIIDEASKRWDGLFCSALSVASDGHNARTHAGPRRLRRRPTR